MLAKCDAPLKGDLCDMVCGRSPFPPLLLEADVGKMWCTAEKRFMHIYATCLFKESMFLWKSKLPLYQKLEVPESCSTLHQLIMVASCLQKIELWYPSFGLQVLIVISVVLYSDCCKSTKNCRDWAFSNSGLEAGLPASLSAADVGKMRHVCCRNPFPPSPFLLEFQASTLPEAWGPWELQHAPPVLNYFIKPIPLLQLQEKPVLCKELNNCQDWAFSNSGLEAGLPAFQLPMLAKCYALPKRDLCIFMRHVCLRNPCFCGNLTLHSTRSLRSLRAAARSTSSELFHQAHPFVAPAGKASLMQRIEQLPRLSF